MIKGVSKVAFNTLLTTHLILCKGVFSCSVPGRRPSSILLVPLGLLDILVSSVGTLVSAPPSCRCHPPSVRTGRELSLLYVPVWMACKVSSLIQSCLLTSLSWPAKLPTRFRQLRRLYAPSAICFVVQLLPPV